MQYQLHKVLAGSYWSDGGALMGVLPWSIWNKKIATDERRRLMMSLNLLLIRSEDRCILVDTGLGNRLSEKQLDIYNPSEFLLPLSLGELGIKDTDITDVIMTHLHFDHAGGIVTDFGTEDRLTFPNATYWIQSKEWEMAKHPDGLNKAAYSFQHQLLLLEQIGKLQLVDGEALVAPGIRLVLTGGHTVGSQIVEIDSSEGFYIYAGDIIATEFHLNPVIISAYDVSREDTYLAKQYIYETLKQKNGYLLLNHDNERWQIPINDL